MDVGHAPMTVETPVQRFRRIAEAGRRSGEMGVGELHGSMERFSSAEVDLLLAALEQGTDWRAEYVRARDAHCRMVEALEVCSDERDAARAELAKAREDLDFRTKDGDYHRAAHVGRLDVVERLEADLKATRAEVERLRDDKPRMQYVFDEDMLRLILSR